MRVVSLLNSGANTKVWLGKVCQTQIMQNRILLCFSTVSEQCKSVWSYASGSSPDIKRSPPGQ